MLKMHDSVLKLTKEDFKQYYHGGLAFCARIDQIVKIHDRHNGQIIATTIRPDGREERVLADCNELIMTPFCGSYRNIENGSGIVVRKPIRQWKKPFNSQTYSVLYDIQNNDPFYYELKFDRKVQRLYVFFKEENYPTLKDAIAEVNNGNRVSCAFSPHFSVCIPKTGDSLLINHLTKPIGKVGDDARVHILESTLFLKEELEQYAEVVPHGKNF